jgi:hypothetical protein
MEVISGIVYLFSCSIPFGVAFPGWMAPWQYCGHVFATSGYAVVNSPNNALGPIADIKDEGTRDGQEMLRGDYTTKKGEKKQGWAKKWGHHVSFRQGVAGPSRPNADI